LRAERQKRNEAVGFVVGAGKGKRQKTVKRPKKKAKNKQKPGTIMLPTLHPPLSTN